MYYIIDHSTDPQWNLATEEYLFKTFKEPVFRLWRNDSSIIIGLHQNAYAEINLDYVKRNNIKVVRRLSGGGAVFHDLGNVNFTFIDNRSTKEESSEMFARFTKPIIEALKILGIEASLMGRNDLVIGGKKFSGNAVAVFKERVLQHGTLLFCSSMDNLSEALANRPEQFEGKGVKSNRSRVTNISEHLTNDMSVEEFISFLEKFILDKNDGKYRLYSYTPKDLKEIARLKMEKYSKESWNFGSSPAFGYSKIKRFDWGLFELYLEIERGVIKDIRFHGNYFFTKETAELENIMRGWSINGQDLREELKRINLSDYFSNITEEEFLEMFL